jgi:hypothetical protein
MSIEESTSDAITLDFSKWSARQRQLKASTDHSLWVKERDAVLRRQQSENEKAKRQYQTRLDAEKAAKRAEIDAETARELEPRKQVVNRQWLADHPDKTAADFESAAWPLLRETS